MTDVSEPDRLSADADVHARAQSSFDVSRWSDASSKDSLRLIAASVAQMVGFEVAVISLVLEGTIVPLIIEGPDNVQDVLAASRTPMRLVLDELDRADDWGRFRFVPHERNGLDIESYGWVPDLEPVDHQHAWHPNDMLLAPLHDGAGRILGLLSIDVPSDGLRPNASQRDLLQRYAAQAERALRIAFEREALAQRLRLAETARTVVRSAASQPDTQQALLDCRRALLAGFRADELAIRAYGDDQTPETGTRRWELPDEQRRLVRRVAHDCWQAQRVVIVSPSAPADDLMDAAERDLLLAYHTPLGHSTLMIVPIGAGQTCMGQLILLRHDPDDVFSLDEQRSCLEIARDIGQTLLTSRNLRRQERLAEEMTWLATYRTELISTVSHELKNPLTALNGHLEILSATESFSAQGQRSLEAMGRASERLRRVVDDLLLMAAADDVGPIDPLPVDVGLLLRDAAEMAGVTASQRGLTIDVDLPHVPVLVCGDAALLDHVVTNLLSNAIKYSRDGTAIAVGAIDLGEQVEIFVSDHGIGISTDDQAKLFTEFFRSTNPAALAEPGTGLGLSIAARIVARHAGTIEVDSTMGEGSTFRVLLPAARVALA